MSILRFKPEIWSAILLTSLKKALVYASEPVVNRNYEGDISQAGDTVRITSISRPTVRNYVPGTDLEREQLTDAQRTLVIDQSKYFNFEVDDVDKRQAQGDVMAEGMRESAHGLRDVADQFVAAFYADVASDNDLGTVPINQYTDMYDDVLVPLGVALDDANVPTEGRWLVIPPVAHGFLLRDDRFIRADAAGSGMGTDALRNGFIGRAAGFDIRKSNNAPNPTDDHRVALAGYPGAISYAEQINKTEAYRPEDAFSDAVKGLHLYGGKLVRPEGIAVATVNPTP